MNTQLTGSHPMWECEAEVGEGPAAGEAAYKRYFCLFLHSLAEQQTAWIDKGAINPTSSACVHITCFDRDAHPVIEATGEVM